MITRLSALRTSDALTEEEFVRMKQPLISNFVG